MLRYIPFLVGLLATHSVSSTVFSQGGIQQSGAITQAAAPAGWMPWAVESPTGGFDLWLVDEQSLNTRKIAQSISFLPIELVGYAHKDRLRHDMPHSAEQDHDSPQGSPEYIVPHLGGALYRVQESGCTALWYINQQHAPRRILETSSALPDGIQKRIHVALDGSAILVATELTAGGNVYRIDLTRDAPPLDITSALPPLDVDARSLRLTNQVAFFRSGNQTYRASTLTNWEASPVAVPLDSEESLESDFVLAPAANLIVAMAKKSDDECRFYAVPMNGPGFRITENTGAYASPEFDNPLGPFVAVSHSAHRLAYLERGLSDELFLAAIAPNGQVEHASQEPEFPAYVDSIGVFSFGSPQALCFFAGDTQLSGLNPQEMIGVGEMYMVHLANLDALNYTNISRTNGQSSPPFTAPGELRFHTALLDPLRQRFLIIGENEEEEQDLHAIRLGAAASAPGVPNVETLLTGGDEPPLLWSVGDQVLVADANEPQNGIDSFRLHTLSPLSGANTYSFETIATLLGDYEAFSTASQRSGMGAALIVEDEDLATRALLQIRVLSGQVYLTSSAIFGNWVSDTVVIGASGSLHVSLGANALQTTPWIFSHGMARRIPLPAGHSFPLAH